MFIITNIDEEAVAELDKPQFSLSATNGTETLLSAFSQSRTAKPTDSKTKSKKVA